MLFCLCLFLVSCADNCKNINGKFSSFSTSLRYDYLFTYDFNDGEVRLLNTSRTGIGADYKSGNTQTGTYEVKGEEVVMNFGGSDVILVINRDANGCISSLSNEDSIYERQK